MAKKKIKSKKTTSAGNNKLAGLTKLKLTKNQTNVLVGAGVAAAAAGAYYLTKGKVDWSFLTGKKGGAKASGSPTAPNAEAPVDVALNNEVAESTVHNPNNDGEFTDDGATGNAD
ncbi:hypothetical protein [uncultured Hymenobacter sp.]|uniref:hypothetical protein n=1 Tax=uncultured Hymenobacter sp. TaxID=170016 RepID=UPI0035CA1E18